MLSRSLEAAPYLVCALFLIVNDQSKTMHFYRPFIFYQLSSIFKTIENRYNKANPFVTTVLLYWDNVTYSALWTPLVRAAAPGPPKPPPFGALSRLDGLIRANDKEETVTRDTIVFWTGTNLAFDLGAVTPRMF